MSVRTLFGDHSSPDAVLNRERMRTRPDPVKSLAEGVSFDSTCEYHMLPFYGTASAGYLPGKVGGVSKLALVSSTVTRDVCRSRNG